MSEFIPTPMPKIYFDHDQSDLSNAFAIPKKRKKQLDRAIEDLDEEQKFDHFSQRVEAVLNLCENEQERIFYSILLGMNQAKNGIKHGMHLGGAIKISKDGVEGMSMDDMPEDLKAFLLKILKGKSPDSEE